MGCIHKNKWICGIFPKYRIFKPYQTCDILHVTSRPPPLTRIIFGLYYFVFKNHFYLYINNLVCYSRVNLGNILKVKNLEKKRTFSLRTEQNVFLDRFHKKYYILHSHLCWSFWKHFADLRQSWSLKPKTTLIYLSIYLHRFFIGMITSKILHNFLSNWYIKSKGGESWSSSLMGKFRSIGWK